MPKETSRVGYRGRNKKERVVIELIRSPGLKGQIHGTCETEENLRSRTGGGAVEYSDPDSPASKHLFQY